MLTSLGCRSGPGRGFVPGTWALVLWLRAGPLDLHPGVRVAWPLARSASLPARCGRVQPPAAGRPPWVPPIRSVWTRGGTASRHAPLHSRYSALCFPDRAAQREAGLRDCLIRAPALESRTLGSRGESRPGAHRRVWLRKGHVSGVAREPGRAPCFLTHQSPPRRAEMNAVPDGDFNSPESGRVLTDRPRWPLPASLTYDGKNWSLNCCQFPFGILRDSPWTAACLLLTPLECEFHE